MQVKVNHVEEKLRTFSDHMDRTTSTIHRNNHSQSASITAMIREQDDVRQLVEELAKRLDQPQETSDTVQGGFSTAMQLELQDLKTKVLRLTEQNTEHSVKLTFLANMSEQVDLMENQIIKIA